MAKSLGLALKGRGFSNIKTGATLVGTDMIGGGTGEFLGQKFAGQPLDIKEIGFEMVTPGIAAGVGVKAISNVAKDVRVHQVEKKLRPTGDNMLQIFSQDTPTEELQVEVARMPGSLDALKLDLRKARTANQITKKGIAEVLNNFRETEISFGIPKWIFVTIEIH